MLLIINITYVSTIYVCLKKKWCEYGLFLNCNNDISEYYTIRKKLSESQIKDAIYNCAYISVFHILVLHKYFTR
jgi:hypothetical protein